MKPWRSFHQQLEILERRGLWIDDREKALSYLERIGYYRLSGYWYPLRKFKAETSPESNSSMRLDEFVEGSSFKQVVQLYLFDKKLRLHVLDAIERIEMAFRVDVAHRLGRRHPLAHLKPTCLHGKFSRPMRHSGKTLHEVWLAKYKSSFNRSKELDFVKHHAEKYDDQLPVWAAIELWDFGMLSLIFSGMQVSDQAIIAQKYEVENWETMGKWLRSINLIRNVAAHHSRMWNMNVVDTSALPQGWPIMPINKPFLYLSIMQHLLQTICPLSEWKRRVKNLITTEFPELPANTTQVQDMGLCDSWSDWELWK